MHPEVSTVGFIIRSTLKMKKLDPREIKELISSPLTHKQRNWDWDPDVPDPHGLPHSVSMGMPLYWIRGTQI